MTINQINFREDPRGHCWAIKLWLLSFCNFFATFFFVSFALADGTVAFERTGGGRAAGAVLGESGGLRAVRRPGKHQASNLARAVHAWIAIASNCDASQEPNSDC